MPTYTYHCESCGVRFDQFQKFTDEPMTICPECGEIALRKVYQPVGIVFKGKGFYATDHRSPSGQTHTHNGSEPSIEPKSESVKPAENSTPTESKSTAKTTAAE